jgi:hypothetical protein
MLGGIDVTLDDLAQFVSSLSESERNALEDEGFFLSLPARPSGYDATPPGYLMFLSTGGDGVHFSTRSSPRADGPILMTVPMCFDSPNLIVGESLHEFLSLGCSSGYFTLEQLAYHRQRAAAAIERVREPSGILAKLSARFSLEPWSDVLERISELNPRSSIGG